jgi:sRNA-binding protein
MLKEITHFFSIYKDLEGKRVEMKGWRDAAYARDRVLYAIKQFKEGKAKQPEGKNQAAENRDQRAGIERRVNSASPARSPQPQDGK